MIDLHSHVLPGVDDGAADLTGSLDILRAAQADVVTRIAATPHVRADHPTTPDTMERLVREVNEAARAEGIGVEVLPGGELDLVRLDTLDDDALRRFGLGGNPKMLLLETPYSGWPLDLADRAFRLATRGFRVVLAHPERCAEVQAQPERLRPLVDAGVLVQVTAASVDGRLGKRAAKSSRELIDAGLAHLIASDAHAPSVRVIGMTAAAAAVGDRALARWLTVDVSESIVAGTTLPPRPTRQRARRLLFRRRH